MSGKDSLSCSPGAERESAPISSGDSLVVHLSMVDCAHTHSLLYQGLLSLPLPLPSPSSSLSFPPLSLQLRAHWQDWCGWNAARRGKVHQLVSAFLGTGMYYEWGATPTRGGALRVTWCVVPPVCTQVIVALSEKSRSHIPYRNSMMTSVLRDRYIPRGMNGAQICCMCCTTSGASQVVSHDSHMICSAPQLRPAGVT